MQIELTPSARNRLSELAAGNHPLKLAYDTEGCGCAVNGVARLWKVAAADPSDEVACREPVTILYDRRQEIFFEDRLSLDFRENTGTFTLKSDNQIYATGLSIEDRTEAS